jgi:cell division protein FtsW
VQQGFIAVGSGGFLGQGYGQSVQKFHYLPEAIGDSVFAVAGEEFGFVGSSVIIILYLLFAFRGFYIARRIPQIFPKLLVIGCTSLILIQSFMNIAAIIGVIPLTGLPLIFMSQGGTALLFSLLAVAAILNASQYMKEIPVNTVA